MSALLNEHPIHVASLLDKVRRLYPHGIPTAYIRASTAPADATPSLTCAFFILRDSVEMNKSLQDLVDAICTKGLRIPRESCSVLTITKDAVSAEQLEEHLSKANAPLRIVLGGLSTPGSTTSTPQGTILYTHSLDLIASDIAIKREFWAHLQRVLPQK